MNKEAVLRTVPLFAHLNERALKSIANLCTQRDYETGEEVIHQGDEGIGLYIIVSGKAKVEKHNADGELVEVAWDGPGDLIGEFSVFDGAPRSASVIATESVSCLVLASWEFMGFLKAHPEVAMDLLPVLVKRFRETNAALLARHPHP